MARMTEEEVCPGLGFRAKSLEQRTENFATYQTASSDFTSLEYGKQS